MGYLVSKETAFDLSAQFRSQKKKIVFTHGTFDLLHVGHIDFLEKSKTKNSILIVGLEPDENIHKYKAMDRPIIPTSHRGKMLESLGIVDFLFINDFLPDNKKYFDAAYYQLYENIKPNYITYGRNFSFKNITQSRISNVSNIKLKEVNAIVKHELDSTTAIINKIRNY